MPGAVIRAFERFGPDLAPLDVRLFCLYFRGAFAADLRSKDFFGRLLVSFPDVEADCFVFKAVFFAKALSLLYRPALGEAFEYRFIDEAT